jgi:UDP-N-acetylmuramoyl-tripeptide--D-alanyl-D-alanine ligase
MTACFTLQEVLTATQGRCISPTGQQTFSGVSTDSRTLQAGVLYVALSGEKFDGHDYAAEAIAKGAAGIVVSRVLPLTVGVPVILVEDCRKALQDLARFHRCRFQVPLIAVTGSNGKTSTKDMIAAVLSTSLNVLKTEANFNNEIGLSQTLLRLDASHQAVVVEMGMRGRGEIAELASIALPTVGVVTNVGETHLERLGTLANIAAAKAELIEALPSSGIAVLNADDELVMAMRTKTAARVVTYAVGSSAEVSASDIEQTAQQVSFRCAADSGRFAVTVPLPGLHTVYNALAAIAVGRLLGLTEEKIAAGLAGYQPGKMRLNIRQYGQITVIDDTYNASPLSMAAAINVLAEIAKGRKIAAIGDMLELGTVAVVAHQKVGVHLATAGAAIVIAVGEMASHAATAATQNGVAKVVACQDHGQAVSELKKLLQPGDTLLIKGSRGMQMEKLLAVFTPTSEE